MIFNELSKLPDKNAGTVLTIPTNLIIYIPMKTKKILLSLFLLGLSGCWVTTPSTYLPSETFKNQLIRKTEETYLLQHIDSIVQSYQSQLSADNLLYQARKYDIDIHFLMAQGILESHLGTAGRAVKTHSVFGVGMYDDKSILSYNHPDESVESYAKLLSENYLDKKNGKGELQLLQNGSFKSMDGYRYASYPSYEQKLRYLYNKLKKDYERKYGH